MTVPPEPENSKLGWRFVMGCGEAIKASQPLPVEHLKSLASASGQLPKPAAIGMADWAAARHLTRAT